MRVCKSDNPNDRFAANDFKFDHNVYVYEEYQRNCCLLGRYFGQFASNSKVFTWFRPTNIVCNFIS